jgi:SAM-dependent methyltransferase
MFEFHTNKKKYFDMQAENSRNYVLPFIEQTFPISPGTRVLEIGCGEAGVLKPFIDRGCIAVGVELHDFRLELAKEFMAEEVRQHKIFFISKDIYKVNVDEEFSARFDIIILKDVIEHIFDQQKLIALMKGFLNPGGVIFFGFPPWQMPFGGHQQVCHSKFLSKLPYFHLLPVFLYKGILKMFNEQTTELLEIKETGISIERFEKITRQTGYKIVNKLHYLINPIYIYKFGLQERKQAKIISAIPYFRNYFTTCVYYLITPN